MRDRSLVTLLLSLAPLAVGCGGTTPGTPGRPAITAEQVADLPLEEAGGLNLRQNLAGPPPRGVLGRDGN